MGVQSVLPFPQFHDLFFAVLVVFVVVRSGGVVDAVPILRDMSFLFVLLALFSSSTLPLLSTIKAIDIIVVCFGCPIGECSLHRSSLGRARRFRRNSV